jgi:hypothetical protein
VLFDPQSIAYLCCQLLGVVLACLLALHHPSCFQLMQEGQH